MNDLETLIEPDSPIGAIEISATSLGLVAVHLPGRLDIRTAGHGTPDLRSSAYQHARSALNQVLEYLAGERKQFDLTLDLRLATPFQRKVYQAAGEIPFGAVLTYGDLAKRLGAVSISRAVGAALGKNPILIVIPCHRVVASDGKLTGFSAGDGIQTKQRLLEMEGHKIVGQKLV